MPSSIRPNYQIDDIDGDTPPADFQIIGYASQPVPDQLQAMTVIRLPIFLTMEFGADIGDLYVGCWAAYWDEKNLRTTSRQIGDYYTVSLPEAAEEGDIITWPAELIWIDTAAQQSGAYLVAYNPPNGAMPLLEPSSPNNNGLSVSLTTVSP